MRALREGFTTGSCAAAAALACCLWQVEGECPKRVEITLPEEAAEEAQWLVDAARDYKIDMPLVFDWENIDQSTVAAGDTVRTAEMTADAMMPMTMEPATVCLSWSSSPAP